MKGRNIIVQKIKFITDSASDIPNDLLMEYDIDMMCIPILADGKEYFERRSFSIHEFYRFLSKTQEIPKTSRIPTEDYVTCYERAYQLGFSAIINVTINAGGSGTYAAAQMAAEMFYERNPDAKDKIEIHIVDSQTYTMAYGYPIVESSKMARAGKSVDEILKYLHDFFNRCEVYLGCYSLEYAKKSGRIGAAAAFVGDVLGLRPVIAMIANKTQVIARVRGDNQLIPQLIKCYEENCDGKDSTVLAICGESAERGIELQRALQKKLGREIPLYNAGASIVINSGPKIVAIVCLGKKR